MMTYYEELGVPAEASQEEIRLAYKRLVRLLHPDHCGDPATRLLAGLQMRRLNGILELLSHPDKRADYDRSLRRGDASRQCPTTAPDATVHREPPDWDGLWCEAPWRRPATAGNTSQAQRACWKVEKAYAREVARQAGYLIDRQPPRSIGGHVLAWWRAARRRWSAMVRSVATLAGIVVLVLFCGLMAPGLLAPKPVTLAVAPRPLSAPQAARRLLAPSLAVTAAQEEDAPAAIPGQGLPEPAAIRAAMLAPADAAGYSPPGERPNALSGDWIFTPAAASTRNGYPPEFIELRLREREGTVRGSYRARYRVTDRAISPNVAFQFAGRTPAEGGALPWRGAGGSQGAVTLRLLANGHLQVEWEADRLSEELGLISGAATLVRKPE